MRTFPGPPTAGYNLRRGESARVPAASSRPIFLHSVALAVQVSSGPAEAGTAVVSLALAGLPAISTCIEKAAKHGYRWRVGCMARCSGGSKVWLVYYSQLGHSCSGSDRRDRWLGRAHRRRLITRVALISRWRARALFARNLTYGHDKSTRRVHTTCTVLAL